MGGAQIQSIDQNARKKNARNTFGQSTSPRRLAIVTNNGIYVQPQITHKLPEISVTNSLTANGSFI